VREYLTRFPDKAMVAWHNDVGQLPALMAGAAQVLTGWWSNPGTDQTIAPALPHKWRKGTILAKPTAESWLLLMR